MPNPDLTRIADVRTGSRVRLASRAGLLTAAGTITTDDGFTLTASPDTPVLVLDIPKPGVIGSAILGSLNGGDDEVFVLSAGSAGNPRWLQSSTKSLVSQADEANLVVRTVLYLASPKPTKGATLQEQLRQAQTVPGDPSRLHMVDVVEDEPR